MAKKKIIFTYMGIGAELYPPKPAKKTLPLWYKELDDYVGGKKELSPNLKINQTGKRCMPMFDAMTFGYLLYTYVDIIVKPLENEEVLITWADKDAVEIHSQEQLQTYKTRYPKGPIPKLINEYGIETPSGYSTYFCPPINHENDIMVISGVVDTDEYTSRINLPFFIRNGFSGVIPAGTPVAQVIPFKRESWNMEVSQKQENIKKSRKVKDSISTVFQNGYRHRYWIRKDFN